MKERRSRGYLSGPPPFSIFLGNVPPNSRYNYFSPNFALYDFLFQSRSGSHSTSQSSQNTYVHSTTINPFVHLQTDELFNQWQIVSLILFVNRTREIKEAVKHVIDEKAQGVDIQRRTQAGYAFLRFSRLGVEHADDIVTQLQGLKVLDQEVVVERARDRPAREEREQNGEGGPYEGGEEHNYSGEGERGFGYRGGRGGRRGGKRYRGARRGRGGAGGGDRPSEGGEEGGDRRRRVRDDDDGGEDYTENRDNSEATGENWGVA